MCTDIQRNKTDNYNMKLSIFIYIYLYLYKLYLLSFSTPGCHMEIFSKLFFSSF